MTNDIQNLLPGLRRPDIGQRTAFCPEDHVVAAFYERRQDMEDGDRFLQHLAECTFCRARIGMLARLDDERHAGTDYEDPAEGLTEDLLAHSKQLFAAAPAPDGKLRPVAAWAAAAVLVLALGLYLNSDMYRSAGQQTVGATTQPVNSEVRQLRNLDQSALRPRIVRPDQGAQLPAGALQVQWTPVTGALHYELLLLDESGRLLANERVQGTNWLLGAADRLQPGGQYYLRVNAYLADGRTAGSKHTAISIDATDAGRR